MFVTKKGIVFIIFLASIISIMIIAVWGTLPENTNLPPIDYLEFTDYDGLNEDLEKMKDLSEIVTETSSIYLLPYDLGPDESYSDLVVSLSVSHLTHHIDTDGRIIYIYYGLEDIQTKIILTVTITDRRTHKSDLINLWFKEDGVVIIPD